MSMHKKDKFLNGIKQRPQLSFALVVSTVLHLLLFTAVTIVVEPALKLTLYPKVAFLGSILNRDIVSWVSLSDKKPHSPTLLASPAELANSEPSLRDTSLRTESFHSSALRDSEQSEGLSGRRSGGRGFSGWNEMTYHKLKVVSDDAPYSFQRKPARIIKRVSFLRFQRNPTTNERPKISILSSAKISKRVNAETIFSGFGEQPGYSGRNSAQTSLDYFQRSLTKLENMLTRDDNSLKLSAQANAIYFPKRLKKVIFLRIRAKNRVSPKTSTYRPQDASGRYLYRKLQLSEITYRSKAIYFPKRSRKELKTVANIFWNSSYQRGVLYKPPLPEDHLKDDRMGGDFNLEFDFLVSPQGRVIAVKKLTSSGFAKIDAQAIRYLKKWQFAPSPREQWGRIRLNFKLR